MGSHRRGCPCGVSPCTQLREGHLPAIDDERMGMVEADEGERRKEDRHYHQENEKREVAGKNPEMSEVPLEEVQWGPASGAEPWREWRRGVASSGWEQVATLTASNSSKGGTSGSSHWIQLRQGGEQGDRG